MFIHIAKDYMKKLEDVDARLSVSLDKDEIQTLGLKLRFYYNELKHYRSLLTGIHDKILEVQHKYGFSTEEDAPDQPPPAIVEAPAPQPPPPPQIIPDKISAFRILSEWVAQLEQQGHDPNELLAGAGEFLKQKTGRPTLDIIFPEEEPEYTPAPARPEQAPAEPPPAESEAPEEHQPNPQALIKHKQYAPDPAHVPMPDVVHETKPDGAEKAEKQEPAPEPPAEVAEQQPAPPPEPPKPAGPPPLDDVFSRCAARISTFDLTSSELLDELDKLLETRRADVIAGLDRILEGAKEPTREKGGVPTLCWGWLAHRTARNGLAINLLTQAVSAGAAYPQTYLALARASLAKNLFEKALINFNFSAKMSPGLDEPRLGAALCLIMLDRAEEAIAHLDAELLVEKDSLAEAAIILSIAFEKLGRLKEAASAVESAVAGCSSPRLRSKCFFRLGQIQEKSKDVLNAISHYESALDADPDNLQARFTLGKLYVHHKAFPLAREHFNYLTRKYPDSEWADRARELL